MLRPVRMARVEVVAPIDKVDKIVRSIGNLGIVHFIDVAKTKEKKYKGVAEEVRRVERENLLLQLSSRINNLVKKLEKVPYPNPIPVEEDPDKVLKEVEERISSLEIECAKIENMMKELNEEKASLERDVRQLYEEHENTKRFLTENKVNLTTLTTLSPKTLALKDHIRSLYDDLVDIQRNLAFIDTAGKMTSSHMPIPNDEAELKKLNENVEETLTLNQVVRRDIPEAAEEANRIEAILNEIKEVIGRKIEALEKIGDIKSRADQLRGKVNKIEEDLTSEAASLLGENFRSSLKEIFSLAESFKALSLGSPKVEELVGKTSSLIYEVRRGFDILENAERYLTLDSVRRLVEEIRGGDIESIKTVFEESRELLAKLPIRHLKTVERAFNILSMEHRIQELTKEPIKLKEKIATIAQKSDYIHAYNEIVEIELMIENLYKKFRQTGKTCVFEVWVKKEDVDKTVNTIKEACPAAIINVAREEEGDKPPTYMKNPKIAEPYEKLVAAYGLPNYHELDPTIITLITFPLIFGLMFGDMGHGLILLIGGLLIPKIWSKAKLQGEIWDAIYNGRNLIVLCGLTATVFGFLYGEFFGPTTIHYAAHHHGIPTWYSDLTGFEKAPWFSPMENLISFFKIALVIGIIHISFGLVLDVVNKLLAGEKREALAPISWLWFYGSLAYLFILIMSPEYGPADVVLNMRLLVMFIVAPFVGMLILHKIATGEFMEAFSESVTKAIESISNTFSYSRILALGVTHAIFSEIALLGAGNPIMFWFVLFMVTLFMIIALEGIITFAHSLRLHWVEWFSKFYKGDGTPFEGFMIRRKFTVAGKV